MAREKKSRGYYAIVTIVFIVPVILVICGAVLLMRGNVRSSNINQYNKRASVWNSQGIKEFGGLKVYMFAESVDMKMKSVNKTTGEFFPVRDRCNYEGDPEGGCMYTQTLYYEKRIQLKGELMTVSFLNKGKIILNDTLITSIKHKVGIREMDCNHETKECEKSCSRFNGTWDLKEETCSYRDYLNRVCYRVSLNENGTLVTDSSVKWDIKTKELGCSYNNKWHPQIYSTNNVTEIPVEIRHYQDSVIAASYFTHGCSDNHQSGNKCMGITHKEASYIGLSFSGIGVLIIVILAVGMGVVNYCRRKGYEYETTPLKTTTEGLI